MYEYDDGTTAGECPRCGSERFWDDGKPVCPECVCFAPAPDARPREWADPVPAHVKARKKRLRLRTSN